jgi:hypothetical protein
MAHGTFSGDPEARWVTEAGLPDRRMRLTEEFSFVDNADKRWVAPLHHVVDGASIPRALWTVVGSPYTGDYRRASVVHDAACDQAGGDPSLRRAADRMFYRACRAGGCSIRQSTLLYIGVRIGAASHYVPAWSAAEKGEDDGPRLRRTAAEERVEADFRLAAEGVLDQGETDDPVEIERRTDEALTLLAGTDLTAR